MQEEKQYLLDSHGQSSSNFEYKPPQPSIIHIGADKDIIIEVPAYLVVLFKKFYNFNFSLGTINVSMTIILRINLRELESFQAERLASVDMVLNDEFPLIFDVKTCDVTENNGIRSFTKRHNQEVSFKPTLHGYPFDTQWIKFKFELSSINAVMGMGKGKPYVFRFNNHVNETPDVMLRFKCSRNARVAAAGNDPVALKQAFQPLEDDDDPDDLPEMDIAYGRLSIPITPTNKKKSAGQNFPSVRMSIPLYRNPEYVIFTNCLPLLVLNICSLCVFLVDSSDFPTRLSLISTLLIALFAFMPTIHPIIDAITVLDVHAFGSVTIMLLVLLDSYLPRAHNALLFMCCALVTAGIAHLVWKYGWYQFNKKRMQTFIGNALKTTAKEFDTTGWILKPSQ